MYTAECVVPGDKITEVLDLLLDTFDLNWKVSCSRERLERDWGTASHKAGRYYLEAHSTADWKYFRPVNYTPLIGSKCRGNDKFIYVDFVIPDPDLAVWLKLNYGGR